MVNKCNSKIYYLTLKNYEDQLKKINDLLKKNKQDYVSKIHANRKNKDKYLKSRKDIIDGIKFEPPKIFYDEDKEQIIFENGKNIFSNLRDLGCKNLSIITDINTNEKMKKLGISEISEVPEVPEVPEVLKIFEDKKVRILKVKENENKNKSKLIK